MHPVSVTLKDLTWRIGRFGRAMREVALANARGRSAIAIPRDAALASPNHMTIMQMLVLKNAIAQHRRVGAGIIAVHAHGANYRGFARIKWPPRASISGRQVISRTVHSGRRNATAVAQPKVCANAYTAHKHYYGDKSQNR